MFQKKNYKDIKHISCSVTIFPTRKSCRLWHNVAGYCRGEQATDDNIRGMRVVCWIPKATNTYSEYVILIVLPLQQWLHECTLVLRFTYIVSVVGTSLLTRVWSSDDSDNAWRYADIDVKLWIIYVGCCCCCCCSLYFGRRWIDHSRTAGDGGCRPNGRSPLDMVHATGQTVDETPRHSRS